MRIPALRDARGDNDRGGRNHSFVPTRNNVSTLTTERAMIQGDEKLSQLQKEIVEHLHTQPEHWRPRSVRTRGDWRPTDRAVLSRALASLERRGLVVRRRPNGRTVCVELTAAGQELAAWLAGAGDRLKALQRENERRLAEQRAALLDLIGRSQAEHPLTQQELVHIMWAIALKRPGIYTDWARRGKPGASTSLLRSRGLSKFRMMG